MKKIGRLLFGFVFFVIANSAFAEVFCVDTAEELQAALTIASANDQDDEVRIVQGTYVGNFVYATATEAYDLAVKGGYAAGCSSQALDPVTTILDGNQTGTVLAVSAGNVTADLSVQGLTLRNGNKDGYGGGLYFAVGSEGTVSVEANVIMGNSANYAGGGVYVSSSGDVTFTNNSIESNINNGAYVGTSGGTITFTNNVIGSNSSTGAHLVTSGGTVVFTNNTIGNNSEGGAFASGGTVAFINNTIQNNGSYGVFVGNYGDSFTYSGAITFTNNTITDNNGGIRVGDFLEGLKSMVTFTNNTVAGNVNAIVYPGARVAGGGIYVNTSEAVAFTHNIIVGNSVYDDGSSAMIFTGGGVYVERPNAVTFTNNIIAGNSADPGDDKYDYGGGVYVEFSEVVTFTNNTLVGNIASSRGGAVAIIMRDGQDSSTVLYNNAFWNNTGPTGRDLWIDNDPDNNYLPAPIQIYGNNFDQSPGTGYWTKIPIIIDSSNLNQIDPEFFDAATGDYHLQLGSPMIDVGYLATPNLPDIDIEGTSRVLGPSVDIGAYEYDDGSDPKAILSVAKSGSGSGTVSSAPSGINCGSDCAQAYTINTTVTLTGTAGTDATFDGWSGNADCTDGLLTMDTNKQCTATFNTVRQLTVSKSGLGKGTITSNPSGISCGSSCSAWFYLNQPVELTANPDTYSWFSGWSGDADCTDGQVTLANHVACTGSFDQIHYLLLVLYPGTGSGTVTSSPAGIDCETDCREEYPAGTTVTLTATAYEGSIFNGWAGACTGKSPTCEVQITEISGVTANFTALVPGTTNTLYVTSTVDGTVTSTPTGITCGTQCDADYDSATIVTLTPTPNSGLAFNGWRGACSGTGICQVPMTLDKAVMAAFGNTYPSQILVLQQEQLGGSGTFAAPRLVVLGPDLTIKAGSNTTVEAGEQVRLLPGFKVEKNATFKARINPTLLP